MPERLMRQSTIGNADKCLKQLEYSLDPSIPYGTGEARVVGTAYHAGLEAYYRARMEGELLPAIEVHKAASNAFWTEAPSVPRWDTSSEEAALKIRPMIDQYLEVGVWPYDYKVIGIEVPFTEPWLNGWKAHGTIDLVVQTPEGFIVLDDHKTAKKPWNRTKDNARHNNQGSWYTYWWWVTSGQMPNFCWSIMTYAGQFERRYATRNRSEILAVIKKAEQIARLVDATGGVDLPPNTDGWWCSEKFCDFWDLCPYGSAMDQDRWVPVEVSSARV